MSTIVAGNFDNKAAADTALQSLRAEGVPGERICSFRVNPPGQHGAYAIGGDEHVSPGAEEGASGAISGAAIGGAIGIGAGLAALPLAGPAGLVAGPALGAYVGSLAGALKGMGQDEEGHAIEAEETHDAGVLLAIEAPEEGERARLGDILKEHGGRDVMQVEGTWRDGMWVDFDPTARETAPTPENRVD